MIKFFWKDRRKLCCFMAETRTCFKAFSDVVLYVNLYWMVVFTAQILLPHSNNHVSAFNVITLDSSFKVQSLVKLAAPVANSRVWFWRWSKLLRSVSDSQGCHAGAAQSRFDQTKAQKVVRSVGFRQFQDVCALAQIALKRDDNDCSMCLICALNEKLLS